MATQKQRGDGKQERIVEELDEWRRNRRGVAFRGSQSFRNGSIRVTRSMNGHGDVKQALATLMCLSRARVDQRSLSELIRFLSASPQCVGVLDTQCHAT
ncbi:hypothetical protein F2P79_019009 [Pimephales promelas]|nr:hypothetical protein F2P79_019009 [Pimephales promelas]